MVDKTSNTTTQLPMPTTGSQTLFMNGTAQGLRDIFFKDWLKEVTLNKLELALL